MCRVVVRCMTPANTRQHKTFRNFPGGFLEGGVDSLDMLESMNIGALPVENLECDPPMSPRMSAALIAEINAGIAGYNTAAAAKDPTPTATEVIVIQRQIRQSLLADEDTFEHQPLTNPQHIDDANCIDRDERKRRQIRMGKLFVKYGVTDFSPPS